MIYALRKLIAFVFLLGIFWYIYRDYDNLFSGRVVSTVSSLMLIFGIFWLTVPFAVVQARIWRRRRKNRRGFEEWMSAGGPEGLHPLKHLPYPVNIAPEESVYNHEKGTFYIDPGTEYDAVSVPGRIGDVAFPGVRRSWRKIQRVHCYFTDRRVLFLGKELDCDVPFSSLREVREAPGGLIFDVAFGGCRVNLAFTFQNPLIARTVLMKFVNLV